MRPTGGPPTPDYIYWLYMFILYPMFILYWFNVDSTLILFLYWFHVDSMLLLYIDSMLLLYWFYNNSILILCWFFIDSMLMLSFFDVGSILILCWYYIDFDSILILCWYYRPIDLVLILYWFIIGFIIDTIGLIILKLFPQCWFTVCDAVPLRKQRMNVPCFLGWNMYY